MSKRVAFVKKATSRDGKEETSFVKGPALLDKTGKTLEAAAATAAATPVVEGVTNHMRRSTLFGPIHKDRSRSMNEEEIMTVLGETKHDKTDEHIHKLQKFLHGLELPGGLRPRPLTKLDHTYENIDTDTLITHELCGLPGKLSLTRGQTLKYFGEKGRDNFYERFKFMQNQRNISVSESDASSELYFSNELNLVDHASIDYPFAPVRPERLTRKADHLALIEEKIKRLDGITASKDEFELAVKEREEKFQRELKARAKLSGVSKLDPSRKLYKTIKEDFDCEIVNLRSKLENTVNELRNDNDDEFSVADSIATTAFVNTTEMDSLLQKTTDDEHLTSAISGNPTKGLPLSPRSTYIDGCIRQQINPRPSLLLRKTLTKELHLHNCSMGDKMGLIFADCLSGLPFIQSINLANNNLTDLSLGPIMQAIMLIPDLIFLDVSENDCDAVFSKLMAEYLARPTCPLLKLVLRNSDLDDYECGEFVASLHTNIKLKELDISHNKVGAAESLNTVFPDTVTGGEAFAELFRSEDCKLECLKIMWNLVRLGGATEFADSLRYNNSLTYLDLSYNAFSQNGGLILGRSLLYNDKLKTLVICNNNIDAQAAFTICASIIENHVLKVVKLDGNPIGDVGAKALMRVAVSVGARVKVSAENCNNLIRDNAAWFNYDKPLHKYQLDLSKPYERAIALQICQLVATHHSYVFKYFNYEPNPPALKDRDWDTLDCSKKGRPVDIIQMKTGVDEATMDKHERDTVQKLRALKDAATDMFRASSLFQEVDVDGGGELDQDEFSILLGKVGIEVDAIRAEEIFRQYDTDGGGSVGIVEFIMFLRSQLAEAEDRLKDYLETPIMSIRGSHARYIPPETGRLYAEVIDSFTTKAIYKKMTNNDRAKMVEAAKTSSDSSTMIEHAVPCFKMRMQEGINTFDTMVAEGGGRVKTAAKLLLQLQDSAESLKFLNKTLKDNKEDWKALKAELGQAIKPLLGYANGYYELDLASDVDKFCFLRLCEISETQKEKRGATSKLGPGITGDVSQKANWTCFRNEFLDNDPVEITAEFARELPKKGTVKFDFSTTERPNRIDVILADVKVVRLMNYNYMIPLTDQARVLDEISILEDYTSKNALLSKKSPYAHTRTKAVEIGIACENFYDNLARRSINVEVAKLKESAKVDEEPERSPSDAKSKAGKVVNSVPQVSLMKRDRNAPSVFLKRKPGLVTTKLNFRNEMRLAAGKEVEEGKVEEQEQEQEQEDDESQSSSEDEGVDGKEALKKKLASLVHIVEPKRDEVTSKLHKMILSRSESPQAIASKYVDILIDFFSKTNFFCRQLAIVIAYFEYGHIKKTEYFGTYNVELVVALYSRIVDIHNIEIVLHQLDGFEVGCVYCRIGYLKLFNPMKPEGAWELNVARIEERVVAKMLCLLSTIEPGQNWLAQEFKWQRDMDPMPGWELTVGWMKEESMPYRGILTLIYYSGEGINKLGCKVNISYRWSLMNMVLADEQEIVDDGTDRIDHPLKERKSDQQMILNTIVYFNYLLDNSTLKKKRFG